MPVMNVPQPVYDWLLTVRARLRADRRRRVTWPEVFEYVQQQQEAADQLKGAGR